MALPAPAVLTPIQKAAGSVNRVLQLEESYPDLDSYCRRAFSVFSVFVFPASFY